MGMNAHANGGLLLESLKIPNFRDFAVKMRPWRERFESTRILGQLLHAVMEANEAQKNFRVFGPDETASKPPWRRDHRIGKEWMAATLPSGREPVADGPVMEILSEHMARAAEGYLLTGRHGLFNCYEASHIIDRWRPARKCSR